MIFPCFHCSFYFVFDFFYLFFFFFFLKEIIKMNCLDQHNFDIAHSYPDQIKTSLFIAIIRVSHFATDLCMYLTVLVVQRVLKTHGKVCLSKFLCWNLCVSEFDTIELLSLSRTSFFYVSFLFALNYNFPLGKVEQRNPNLQKFARVVVVSRRVREFSIPFYSQTFFAIQFSFHCFQKHRHRRAYSFSFYSFIFLPFPYFFPIFFQDFKEVNSLSREFLTIKILDPTWNMLYYNFT